MNTSLSFGEPGELFAALQSAHATAQAQIDRFNGQMAVVKELAAQTDDPSRLTELGAVSVILRRVHTLLFGTTEPASEASTGAEGAPTLASVFDEFSALMQASRARTQEVEVLLTQSDWQLNHLQAAFA
jgi:hypothetical protein